MERTIVRWNTARPNGPGWYEDENGCHIWTGARMGKGYASGSDGKGGVAGIYRIRYEREIGPIPEGMELDHYVCNNGAGGCCNPHHCRPVSHRENILRSNGLASQRAARTHCDNGHPLSGANLIDCDISKRGFRRCRICTNERQRREHATDEWRAKRREARRKNRDAINAARRTPEARAKQTAIHRAWVEANREEVNAYARARKAAKRAQNLAVERGRL